MKKYLYSLILVLCFLIVSRPAFSQPVKHTPYPIIFIHGLVGDNSTWSQDGEYNDIIDYLEGAGLQSGGNLDITLDYYRDINSLANTKEQDVHLFGTDTAIGDFYTINFNVHATGITPITHCDFKNVNEFSNTETEIEVTNPDQFYIGDIIVIEDEYMQVTDKIGDIITVTRHILDSQAISHTENEQGFNLSLESNQASIAKQAFGLKQAIDAIKIKTQSEKVILVGHSMGGLAAREYIRSYYSNDVAKIVTIGTPHYGSNLAAFPGLPFSIKGIDASSDAYRDLKTGGDDFWHYLLYGYLGVYLYGGNESSISDFLYSKDVNGNGTENDNIIGLNSFVPPFPEEVSRTWIVSSWNGWDHDGVVLTSSQYIYEGDTIMTNRAHMQDLFGIPSLGESSDYYSLLRGLDEPDNIYMAYEIEENSITKGFITFGTYNNPVDDHDLFKINLADRSELTISILGNSSTGIQLIELLDSDLGFLKSTSDIYSPMLDTLDSGTYYIRIQGIATGISYQYPYTLTTNTTVLPPSSLAATPDDLLEYYDVVVNEYRDKIVALTNNGSETITVSNIELTGPEADQYAVTSLTSFDIPPSSTMDVTVRLSPTLSGVKTATLVITNNSLDAPVINLPLHGIGVDSATMTLVMYPDSVYNFGNVTITHNRTKTFKFKNTGSDTMTVTGLTLSGMNANQYSIISQPDIPFNIATGEIKQATIKFLPTSIGVKSADFVFINNSDNASPKDSITLYGNGKNSIYTGIYNTITAYEYWFDDNYTAKVSAEVTPQKVILFNTTLSSNGLTDGLHQLHIRFKDENNRWGSVITEVFHKLPIMPEGTRKITAYERWFDNDYAEKVIAPFEPEQICIMDSTINAASLSTGLHSYHTRFKDDAGQWSSVVSEVFHKLPILPEGERNITEYEYWFDNDYADKVTASVPAQQTYTLNGNIDAISLPVGLHSYHMRFKDDGNQWSSIITEFIHKLRITASTPNLITAYRYWFDMADSSMVNLNLPVPTNPYHLIQNYCVENLPIGNHTVHFQFKDTLQQWSSILTDTIFKDTIIAPIIETSGPTTFCQGDSVTLSVRAANSYLWSNAETTQSIVVKSSGNYFVTLDEGSECSLTSNIITVIANTPPAQPGTISGPTTVASGTTVNYSISPVSGAISYTWSYTGGGTPVGTGTSITLTPISSGTLSVVANNSCGSSPARTLAITVTTVPVTRLLQNITIVNGQSECYDATQTLTVAGGSTTFIIQNGGAATLIAGQNILLLPGTLVQSGGYMLAYITTNGLYCGALESAIVSIPPPEEEDQPNPNLTGQSFTIFPNPTTGQFTLLLDEPIGDQPCYLQVTGMLGNQIIRQRLEGSDHFEFDLSGQNPGIYIIRLITGDRIETKKLVKN